MKYTCDLIRDLLPLYLDGVCSADSSRAVEEHLDDCGECRKLYESMREQTAYFDRISDTENEQQIASIKEVKRKLKKKNRIIGAVGIVIGILLAILALRLVLLAGAFASLVWQVEKSPVVVRDDIAHYQDYIGEQAVKPYHGKWGMDEAVFPAEITADMQVQEFKFVYYDPWDAQYLACLTVEYTSDGYARELARLSRQKQEEYVGYYSVTGAPAGYEVLAMDADAYQGFVYALTPEEDSTTVTYVMTIFCNYFLDLEPRDYIQEQYLLQGFDAGKENPYRKEKLGK